MNFVEPIRDKRKIEEMKEELKKNGTRDYLLFVYGINVGLRISDIVKLKVKDILNSDRSMKNHVEIREKKSKKIKRFKINSILSEELYQYIKKMDFDRYIFKSRKGKNKSITRNRAYTILNDAAKICELEDIGTHTLRKTFGYHFYLKTNDIGLLQELFNHSSPSITLRYIGINQDSIDLAYDSFNL